LGVKEQLKKQVITNEEQATEITRMTRTIDNGKEEKNAAEKKKKEQEAAHSELQKLHEQVSKEKAALEEKNNELSLTSQEHARRARQAEEESDERERERARAAKELHNLKRTDADRQVEMSALAVGIRNAEREAKRTDRGNKQLELEKKRLAEGKAAAVTEKAAAMNAVQALTREIEWLRKQTEIEQQGLMKLVRDRDMLKKNLAKIAEANDENKSQLLQKDQLLSTLHEQADNNKENIASLIKQIENVEKERDALSQQANKANANLMQMVEEVKLKKNLIGELKKENIEFESKLKQQQNLYEVVRSDRNLYGKNLIEANDEVIELRKRFKIAQYQIAQLKDEIEAKDQALTAEHHELGVYMKRQEQTKKALKTEENLRKVANEFLTEKGNEITKLRFIIKEAVLEHEYARKEHQKTIIERDILGTQLIRRNDELALLYEKIKILQITLAKGEVQYQERLEDIKLLKFKISDLKCELRIEKGKAAQIDDLRKEVFSLSNALQKERLQVKALSEELENPLNYHRWRKLEGTDPDTWELLNKIQTLQKRLIKKTEEVVEKDVTIQEKEKLYVELKNLLARQPGPEVAEQLSIYQQNLKEKTSQMKAMAAELNMYQAQVNEYKYEIERLTRELQDMKRKYYEQKRREQMQREAQQRLEPRVIN
jgi:chromosome segregation ATPase